MRTEMITCLGLVACAPAVDGASGGEEAAGTQMGASVSGNDQGATGQAPPSSGSGSSEGADASEVGEDSGGTAGAGIECGLPELGELGTTPGPFGWSTLEVSLVDRSRPTPAHGTFDGSEVRELPTTVWLPEASAGRSPLVVYAHGLAAPSIDGTYLAEAWASYGYVVAAPQFPGTHNGAPGGPNPADVASQPRDLAFVIDALRAASGDGGSPLFGRVDPESTALTGLSAGALTTLLTLHDPPPGVRAAILLATPTCFIEDDPFGRGGVATLAVHGGADVVTPFDEHAVPLLPWLPPGSAVVRMQQATHTGFSSVARAATRGLEHADELGCNYLQMFPDVWSEIAAPLGGHARACTEPCAARPPWPDALDAGVQARAAVAVSLIHLERTLRGCADAEALWGILESGQASGIEVL